MKTSLLRILVLVLLCVMLSGNAAQVPFKDDYEGINRAAGSVLMLLVYDEEEGSYIASGSGFVAFDNQTLITNYHVVEDGELVLAESDEGKTYLLDSVLAADRDLDLAILHFGRDTQFEPLPLNDTGNALRGQPVVAIGSPEGLRNTVSKGDISATFTEYGVRYLQFTAPISSGSSGGALLDNEGKVIGVTSSTMRGDSQNLNFAVDIREAIALYEAARDEQPRPLSELASQTARANPEGDSQGTHTNTSITQMNVQQIAPDAVVLSWNTADRSGIYFVGYEIEGSTYYTYEDTEDLSLVISDLVPGQTYLFYVAESYSGLDEPGSTVSLTLEEAKPFTQRDAHMLFSGLYYIPQGFNPQVPLKEGLATITTAQLQRAREDMELCFLYRLRLEGAQTASAGNCQYTLTTSSGVTYTAEFTYEYEARRDAFIRRADLRGVLDSVMEFEDSFEIGHWTAAVYHDGALLAQTGFEVVPGGLNLDEGRNTKTDAFHATVQTNAVVLHWPRTEGAASYNVFRASAKDGHAFYLGTTHTNSYTDHNAVTGRAYYYQYAPVDGEKSPPLQVTVAVTGADTAYESPTNSIELPLQLGEMAYVGDRYEPYIDPDLINTSKDQTVTGVTLAFYTEGCDFETLTWADSGQALTYYTYDLTIPPGQTMNPGRLSLRKYGESLNEIYVAISAVRLSDGSDITVPQEDLVFSSWTLDE